MIGTDRAATGRATGLDRIAATGRTGTATWSTGPGSAALHLRDGRVVGADRDGAPPESTGPSSPEWRSITLEAILDVAYDLLLPGPGEADPEMTFRPGDVPPWTSSGASLTLDRLHAEIARRQRVLHRLQTVLTPDSTLFRASSEWPAPMQVSAQQWRVLRTLKNGESARSLSRRMGVGTFPLTLAVRTMMQLGMVVTEPWTGAAALSNTPLGRTLLLDSVTPDDDAGVTG